jgi:AraC-like DNA-binding protein
MFDSSLQRFREATGPLERQRELSQRVARLAPFDGTHQSVLPSLALTRSSVPTVRMPTVYQPCLAIVVQGCKRALLKLKQHYAVPLQYQKHLRLHEARRLMFADGIESATAGHRVGYESASQFSREYRRLFGAPPRSEIARLREAGLPA